jgi:DNA-binding LacI/PurR family transcriptional regulator
MPATQKDIAQKIGVSQRLVSYALNGQAGVSDAMRQRILQTADALGYVPNRMARALVTGRTHQIALCLQRLTSTFAHEVTQHFVKIVMDSPYQLMTVNSMGPVHQGGISGVDGAIFFGSVPPDAVTHFPVVEILNDTRGFHAGEPIRHDAIILIFEDASRAAMKHLLEQQMRRIAFVSIPCLMELYEPRYRAYGTLMAAAGLPVEKIVIESRDLLIRDCVHQTLEKYFSEHGFPDALFCSNDDIAIGAYRVLRRMGRRIPHETAVLGCDDIEESKDHVPALTSIQFPCEAICRCAWEMLTARIENPALPPRTKSFKGRLVVRESTTRKRIASLVNLKN